MDILEFLFEEAKEDTSLYALITAFNIEEIEVYDIDLLRFMKNKLSASKEDFNINEFKRVLIAEIKNPANDMFFRKLGLQDNYIELHDRTYGEGPDISDRLLDEYDNFIDFINEQEHMKKLD